MQYEVQSQCYKRVIAVTLMILILLLLQATLPLVSPAEAAGIGENETHSLICVLGDNRNRDALEAAACAAPINTTLNVSIMDETAAGVYNFTDETALFVASIGNATVDHINGTLCPNATAITYDLPEGTAFGTPADEVLTNYWLYGGETNLEQFLLALDNHIYGADHDLADPVPPSGRPKIACVFSRTSEVSSMTSVSEDSTIRSMMDISVHLGRSNEDLSFSLDGNDVILLSNLDAPVIEAISDTVQDARANGSVILACGPLVQSYNLHTVDPADPAAIEIAAYLEYPSNTNFDNLARFIGVTYCNSTADTAPPEERPVYGIYHPDAPNIFATSAEYLSWYAASGVYNPARPTVGIITGDYKYMERDGPMTDALVRSFESEGVNVIVATYHYKDPVRIGYFLNNGEVLIDTAVLISKGSRLDYSDPDRGIENLQHLNVPVLNAVRLFYDVNESTWRNSPHGVGPEQAYQLVMAELDGVIEPIVIAGKEPDPVTAELYYKPFDDQVTWLTERTLGWMNLHCTSNAEKKIVVPYYSAEGGRATVGADIDYYLNAQASLANLLKAMQERGYDLGTGPLPDEDELADLMATQGYNIGTWAQEELNRRVEAGDVILIPEDQYLAWFNELPAAKRQEMNEIWGEAPGEIMVYENGGARSLVIPTIQFGNVLLVPDPMWGWNQDTDVMYHDGSIPPTHQCLAFYYYMDRIYQADAIFSIFSSIEMMPGKESGLAADDWGALLMGDMPHVHVLPMDAEGMFDRRRANMAIVDFMTPTIVPSGLYGSLADLDDTITNYRTVGDEAVKAEYRSEILATVRELDLDTDLGVDPGALEGDDAAFDAFVDDLDDYLTELKTTFMPYGSHTLSEVPAGDELVAMIDGMLGSSFADHVAATGGSEETHLALLAAVILNGTSPVDAQTVFLGGTSAEITTDLNLALDYKSRIDACSIEIPRILDALEARYIPPGPNGDPVRNPDALPTGRNLCTFDDRIIPTEAAWTVGRTLGDDLLAAHIASHGTYPDKVAFLLWSIETSRHQGTMEAEILYLLGVKPVWNKYGRVDDVELIPSAELGRPRIDVLVVTSGSYRDMYAGKLLLIDRAVRLAAAADDGDTPNYVREHTEAIYRDLIGAGYDEETAWELAASRIFCPPPDSYTPGIEHAIGASDTWTDTDAIAELYISRMGYIYGSTIWGEQYADVFRANLGGVDAAVFSRTSNVYGTLEHPMVAAYFGGLNLAVKSVSGISPDMYINNQRDAQNQKLETLQRFVSRDLRSRYLNPEWIQGMMDQGFDGARYMEAFIENMWLWDVAMPELITEEMWNSVYETYLEDQYNLGLKEFFNTHNPYAYQSLTARMLDAARKGYWNPDTEVLQSLAQELQQSVEMHGVTCCHHTCGNLQLDAYIQGLISGTQTPAGSGGGASTGKLASSYSAASSAVPTFTPIPSGMNDAQTPTNTTDASGVGITVDAVAESLMKAAQDVTGHVMREETKEAVATPMTSTPLIPVVLVACVVGAISIGFWFRRR
ncbi:cobaltochelatase subunit CobN [Methanoculleus taiwanensis]|uniref:cobaltochelatase subunit CobN n=1 Tax=Methanoculleus taiwanensis TaxID=1550565 RepID=UPI001F4F37E4|nr:cobaltochelatase subunit CobN [Methanoculleus taiwanensis]